jgi:hypothetical protein
MVMARQARIRQAWRERHSKARDARQARQGEICPGKARMAWQAW